VTVKRSWLRMNEWLASAMVMIMITTVQLTQRPLLITTRRFALSVLRLCSVLAWCGGTR
jgi:hypothetical protein